MNVVIYARYSSHNQTEQSIEGQIKVCKEYAERNDYKIIHIYKDEARSGTSDSREQFQQMIEDSSKKQFHKEKKSNEIKLHFAIWPCYANQSNFSFNCSNENHRRYDKDDRYKQRWYNCLLKLRRFPRKEKKIKAA